MRFRAVQTVNQHLLRILEREHRAEFRRDANVDQVHPARGDTGRSLVRPDCEILKVEILKRRIRLADQPRGALSLLTGDVVELDVAESRRLSVGFSE